MTFRLFFLFASLITANLYALDPYPADWWKPFPKEEAPAWEILPQEATYGIDVILSKRTELGIFSNFSNTPFKLDGKTYASIEGFWQMMKYPDPDDPADPRQRPDLHWKYTREQVSQLFGFDAKQAGDAAKENYEKLGIKWISYHGKRMEYKGKDQEEHYKLIDLATQSKIDQNLKAKELLIKTGNLLLRPDHRQPADATPAYRYHEILMNIRKQQQYSMEY
jgi:hypothetical protein